MPARQRAPAFGTNELARLLGVARETVRQWTAAGCPRLDSGEYVLAEVVAWRVRQAVEKERAGRKADAAPKTEMNRKLAVEADLKELQLAQMRGALVPAALHDEQMQRVVGGLAAVAKGQLTRFEREIVRATTAPEARKVTERIHEALMRGAQGLADELEAEAAALEAADEAADMEDAIA